MIIDVDALITAIMARRTAASGQAVFVDRVILRLLIEAASRAAMIPDGAIG